MRHVLTRETRQIEMEEGEKDRDAMLLQRVFIQFQIRMCSRDVFESMPRPEQGGIRVHMLLSP